MSFGTSEVLSSTFFPSYNALIKERNNQPLPLIECRFSCIPADITTHVLMPYLLYAVQNPGEEHALKKFASINCKTRALAYSPVTEYARSLNFSGLNSLEAQNFLNDVQKGWAILFKIETIKRSYLPLLGKNNNIDFDQIVNVTQNHTSIKCLIYAQFIYCLNRIPTLPAFVALGIKLNSPLNTPHVFNERPLDLALEISIRSISPLLILGATPNYVASDGDTPLIRLCRNKFIKSYQRPFELLVNKCSLEILKFDVEDETAETLLRQKNLHTFIEIIQIREKNLSK